MTILFDRGTEALQHNCLGVIKLLTNYFFRLIYDIIVTPHPAYQITVIMLIVHLLEAIKGNINPIRVLKVRRRGAYSYIVQIEISQ